MMLNRSRLLWVMSRHGRDSMTKLQTRCWATHAVTRQNDCMSTSAFKIPTTGYCQRHCPTGSCSHSLLPAKWSRWSGVAVVHRCGLKLSTLSITAECRYLRVSCTEGTALMAPLQPCTDLTPFRLPSFLCCLCTGYLEQYTCFHPWFWHIWALSKLLRKHTSSTLPHSIYTSWSRRLRFTHSWLTARRQPKTYLWLIDK